MVNYGSVLAGWGESARTLPTRVRLTVTCRRWWLSTFPVTTLGIVMISFTRAAKSVAETLVVTLLLRANRVTLVSELKAMTTFDIALSRFSSGVTRIRAAIRTVRCPKLALRLKKVLLRRW